MTATNAYQILSLAGRCRTGSDQQGVLQHAVPIGAILPGDIMGKALCGKEPGRRSVGWSCYPGRAVTCPKCLKKIA